MYYVYQIKINGIVRYIGRTNNIDRREKEHRYHFKRGDKKAFYDYMRDINYTDDIVLEPIYKTKNKVESKRYECYHILWYHFDVDATQLKQKIPSIKDR